MYPDERNGGFHIRSSKKAFAGWPSHTLWQDGSAGQNWRCTSSLWPAQAFLLGTEWKPSCASLPVVANRRPSFPHALSPWRDDASIRGNSWTILDEKPQHQTNPEADAAHIPRERACV